MSVLWQHRRPDEERAGEPPLAEFWLRDGRLMATAPSGAARIFAAFGGKLAWQAGTWPTAAFDNPTPRLIARLLWTLGEAGYGPVKVRKSAYRALAEEPL